jgi:hypothetical protein
MTVRARKTFAATSTSKLEFSLSNIIFIGRIDGRSDQAGSTNQRIHIGTAANSETSGSTRNVDSED